MPFDYHKHLVITAPMLAQIQALAGVALSAEDVVVFEATAANTRAVKKPGSLYNGSTITKATLDEMALAVNTGAQAVPLHTMHQASSELPVGKVFQAEVRGTLDGNYELRALFYLPKSAEGLVEKINVGILDEVSIGASFKKLLCNQCGYDYIAPEADFMAVWDQTCPQGHVIGHDGVHVIATGLDLWSELSLVSRGAIPKTKIHGHAAVSETQQRLAASGFAPGALTLCASPQQPKQEALVPDPKDTFDPAAAAAALQASMDAMLALLTPKQPEPVDPALAAAQAEVLALQAQLAAAVTPKVEVGALTAALPVDGIAAPAIVDATISPLVKTGIFKSPRK